MKSIRFLNAIFSKLTAFLKHANFRPASAQWHCVIFAILFIPALTLAQPSNDICGQAIFINCDDDVVFGNNIDADDDALPACGLVSASQTVWYEITGIEGEITVSTCNSGTDFDSQIGIFTNPCFSLTCVDGNNNDPYCGEDILDATVTWASTEGQTYYIAIGGVSGTEGNIRTFHFQKLSCYRL